MSLLDELLKKAEKRPDKVDIPPQLERIVAKGNKGWGPQKIVRFFGVRVRIYVISGVVIFAIFSGIILLALIGRFTGFIQVEGKKIAHVSEIRSPKSDTQGPQKIVRFSGVRDMEPSSGIPEGSASQNFNTRGENAAEEPVSPVKSAGKSETVSPEITRKKDVQRKVRPRDREKEKKEPDSMETPRVSGTEIPKQDPNQTVIENGKALEKRGLLYRANTLELNGKYEEAIEYYERALRIDPSDYRVMNQIAYLYIKLGIPDRAIEYIERLKKFRSDYVPSMINLSVALMMKAGHAEAERVLLEVLRIEPFNKTALFNLAILNENRGRLEEAEGYYKRLLSTGDPRGKEGLKRIKSKKPLIDKNHDKDDQDKKENPEP